MNYSGARRPLRVFWFASIGLVVAIAIAGCGSGSSSNTASGNSTGAGGSSEAAKPEQGGTLNIAQQEEIENLNPPEVFLPADINISSNISEPLWKVNFEEKLVPWLVEKADVSKNGKVWTLHLRKGVKFSNGKPLTSADVKFSLDTYRKDQVWGPTLEEISNVEASNPSTVIVTTSKPSPELPVILSQWSFAIVPDNWGGETREAFSSKPIGTGPFMLKEWKHGESFTLVRNPYYWQQGKPYLDAVVGHTVPDPNSRVAQLKSGELDVIYGQPWAQNEAIENDSETEVAEVPLGYLKLLTLNSARPLFKNVKVREAISLALDREALNEAVLNGAGEPAGSIVPPPIEFYDASIKPPAQDMAKAKELLAEAEKEGAPSPTFTLILQRDDFWPAAAQIIQQQLDEAGFHVNIETLEISTWLEAVANEEFDATGRIINSALPTPSEVFGLYLGENGYNTGSAVAQMQQLMTKARGEANEKKREQYYFQMQELVNKEKYIINVVYAPYPWAFRKNVTGLYVGAEGIPYFAETGFTG